MASGVNDVPVGRNCKGKSRPTSFVNAGDTLSLAPRQQIRSETLA